MSNRNELKWENVQTNGTGKNFAGWNASNVPIEIPPASGAEAIAGLDDTKPITPSVLATLLAVLNASEIAKGLVEEATDAEVQAGTAVGATGAKLFVSPAKLRGYIDLLRTPVALSAGVVTLNCLNKIGVKFENITTLTANHTIAFSNDTVTELIEYGFFATGTLAITMPANVVMERADTRWVNFTKILTIACLTAESVELSFKWINGNKYQLRIGGPYYAS